MLRTLPSLSSILVALSLAGFAIACDDDTASSSSTGDAGIDTQSSGGSDSGNGGGSDDRERPTTLPGSESTPATPANDRVAEASDRAVRDAAENRTPAVVPDDAARPFDDETVALATEFVEYCWDACDLTDICLDAPGTFRAACYENCVDDLERVLSGLTADEEGKDCLDAVVEAFFCETSFDSTTIVGVCDEFENDVIAQSGVCDPEYVDVDYYCASYDDTLRWFFEEDEIGGGDLLPETPDDNDRTEEIENLLDEVAGQCDDECFAADICLELDQSITDECLLDCDDELVELEDALTGGGDGEANCLDAIAEYYDCRLALTCDDLIDEDEGADWACGAQFDDIGIFCDVFFDF